MKKLVLFYNSPADTTLRIISSVTEEEAKKYPQTFKTGCFLFVCESIEDVNDDWVNDQYTFVNPYTEKAFRLV